MLGRAASYVIEEVRRQFRANPGIMVGSAKPDYGSSIDFVTLGASGFQEVPEPETSNQPACSAQDRLALRRPSKELISSGVRC
jgi:hypothetical protein